MKTYFAWAKRKNSANSFVQTYLNAVNITQARERFNEDYELDSKVSLAKHQ